jgi:RNA polymerase sigma-70 factor (sigma-E family)
VTFEEFVAARLPSLLRQATMFAGDRYVAEDVVQDVLVKAQSQWARIGALDLPEAYVRRMIINEFVSVRRRLAARMRREQVAPPAPVRDGADAVAEYDALVRLIRQLPPRQRIVIALRYLEDMADGDIAALLGIGLGTVRSQAARALTTLRGVLRAPEAEALTAPEAEALTAVPCDATNLEER